MRKYHELTTLFNGKQHVQYISCPLLLVIIYQNAPLVIFLANY